MNRLKLLATATLMALTFTACDEGTPPPVEPPPPPTPVGTISGTVTIEGTAASGITATLSSGATTTTGSGGSFAFSGVEAGTYTVTISGFPEDATFAQVTQSATIATDGQNVQLNFAGEYIRSSAVVGSVVAADAMMSGGDGQPETLAGVTVTLDGEHAMGETMETGMDGGFAFTGLRAGTYTVTISDYPEDVTFETVSVEVEVEVGEVGPADFTGHYIRTSAVEGQVVIEGEGLAGVTVTLSGGPADESYTTMTDADGMYSFEDLRPGDYTVSISDFDTRDYEFAATSQDVSVDLEERETVSFTGVLLRTSGISGRVSVEGMGLGDIAVTLSGGGMDEARTATTDAGGQYSFAGLAAGDYTVSIAVESDAYVFDSMSADVTLGDDESAIQNFEGMHATTASVSGMVFLDEATKNDMYDEGETALASAGIPVALVGPGVNEQRVGATDAAGAFSFTGLRAGAYQLVVLLDPATAAALAANHVAYGGDATGYSIALGVGEAATQNVPFDITHTTVNFTVSLRHGDDTGAALPGAMVTLYSGENKVGSGETGDDGSVSIAVARAGTSGNMVKAGVSADGYHVADGMTDVTWDPQMFATAAGNSNDIVNLNVNASVSGATITTDYGGGKALAGWAIGVTMGDDAVDGAPTKLDDDGNASLTTTVGADDLPATFSFAVADDQDNKLDGGENYSAQAVEHTHTGLALAGEMDAGTIEVAYTTQTLKVYVHHEKDQVKGYTGNILGADVRDTDNVTVAVRYIDSGGRSRSFAAADSVKSSSSKGVHTFSNVPADKNVIAQASLKAGVTGVKLLDSDVDGHSDELAAYTGMEANGITGGAFGAMGGFSHTVELCPLQDVNPTGQHHGECASFAYVSTYTVSGLIWKKIVKTDGESFKTTGAGVDPAFVAGTTVGLAPVAGQNLAGKDESFTTKAKDDRKDKTTGRNPTHQFGFDNIAAGVYKLGVPDGWRARMGDKGATAMVGDALNPLGGNVSLDITPATGTVYGRVVDKDGFPLEGATVTANARTATTDAKGRYIIDDISAETRTIDKVKQSNRIFVKASKDKVGEKSADHIAFAANAPTEIPDIKLSAAGATASVSGTIRASGTNAPVAGVEVKIDGKAPTNAAKSGSNKGKLVTGADGTYTAMFNAKKIGETVDVTVSKAGMSFVPATLAAPAHPGSAITGLDFTGFLHATISGRVAAPGGGPMAGVEIKATKAGATAGTAATDADTTGTTGTFSLSVPFGSYTLAATDTVSGSGTVLTIPAAYRATVAVAPGQSVAVGTITAKTASALSVSAKRILGVGEAENRRTDQHSPNTEVTWTATADDVPAGYQNATYQIQTCVPATGDSPETCGAASSGWEEASIINSGTAEPATTGATKDTITTPTAAAADMGFRVRIVATVTDADADPQQDNLTLRSAVVSLGAVDPSASDVAAKRGVRGTGDSAVDTLGVSWKATTNSRSQFRIVVEVATANLGTTNWFVATGGSSIEQGTRKWSRNIGTDAVTWNIATETGTGGDASITQAELNKAIKVAVEYVQGTPSATNKWKRSAVVNVAAKSSS